MNNPIVRPLYAIFNRNIHKISHQGHFFGLIRATLTLTPEDLYRARLVLP